MITVSVPNILQNIRLLRHSGKKIFVDLSYNAFGIGVDKLYRYLSFEVDGFIWDSNVENFSLFTKNPNKLPMIVSRSHIDSNFLNNICYSNKIATLHSIKDFTDIINIASSGVIRIMLEVSDFSSENSCGLSSAEVEYVVNSVNGNPAYGGIKILGFIQSKFDKTTRETLKTKYPSYDVCCYDNVTDSDKVFVSSMLYGYDSDGNRKPNLLKACSLKGSILDYKVLKDSAFYVTDIPSFYGSCIKSLLIDGEEVSDLHTVELGQVSFYGFKLSKQHSYPSSIEIPYPDTFKGLLELINQPSVRNISFSTKPIK